MKLWPRTILGQFLLLLVIIVLLLQLSTWFALTVQHRTVVRNAANVAFAERVAAAYLLLEDSPKEQWEQLLTAISTRFGRFSVASEPIVGEDYEPTIRDGIGTSIRSNLPATIDLAMRIENYTVEGRRRRGNQSTIFWRLALGEQSQTDLSMMLSDGQWLNIVRRTRTPSLWALPIASALVCAIAIALLAGFIMARRIAGPLKELQLATQKLGRGEKTELLKKEGPEDLQQVIASFNEMQERLSRFVGDRTSMLAAISHDLRTPITSLKLRAEFIEDTELQEKVQETLDEMEAMVDASLQFVREDMSNEATQQVDLAGLLASMSEDFSDLGEPVEYVGLETYVYKCRHLSIVRAVRNIIDNALRYGNNAKIQLSTTNDAVTIKVSDKGPGIDKAKMKEVFEPFVRLEKSRNKNTGGIGLGLSIARSIIRSHGGEINLANLPESGLEVTIELPT